jgi:hypothetical protein
MKERLVNKRLLLVSLLLVSGFSAAATMDEYEALEKKAMAGDYQAQRNVAYWLTGGNNGAPPLNPVLGCAWRLVILKSGSPSVDSSDISNKQLYCDKRLDADSRKAAEAQAEKLFKQIKKPSTK